MNRLLCDSGPLIATFNRRESQHRRCAQLLAGWSGRLVTAPDIATIDDKMVGRMNPACRLQPLRWVLQEN